MKRVISLLTALALTMALAASALAEPEPETFAEAAVPTPGVDAPALAGAVAEDAGEDPDMDEALAQLTLLVKDTLQIDDGYTDFSSDYYDGVTPYWSLYWSDDVRQLSVSVREDGTVLNANLWSDSGGWDRFYGFDPAFPTLTGEQAQAQADAWLERLFTEPETGRVDSVRTVLGANGNYRFSGTVELNGLPSPVTFDLCVDGNGLSSFYRSDSYDGYEGDIPPAEPAADEAAGAEGLAGAVELELRYVSDGEGGAGLRYMPVGPATVVDAQTGEAVDMDALYASFGGGGWNGAYARGAAEEAMAASDGGARLTEAEQATVDNYKAAMPQDQLDASLRDMAALGLDPFTLQRCSYSMDRETGDVTVSLDYAAPMTGEELYGYTASGLDMATDPVIYKYITVDAKTGLLRSVQTTYPLWEKDPAVTMDRAGREQAAADFLAQAVPVMAAEAELCTLQGYNEGDAVAYAQVHEGYFFPDNYLSVTVNPSTGTVDLFSCAWKDVSFGPADDPVTAEEALDAYTDSLDVTLGYVAWPVDITGSGNGDLAPLLERGYTYVEELRLGYYYDGLESVQGVDALTGQVQRTEEPAEAVYAYEDLADTEQAPEIQALGQAGIGFEGGSFQPAAELTQRDAVRLLLQADGETVLADETDDVLLERAAWRGFVTEDGWTPDGTVTRMAFIRMVLGASRYGDAARLLDAGAGEGFEAIARALGMDTADPDGTITRADAAVILYRFMDR